MREHLTHKAGKFRFSEEYRKERVDLLLAQAAILNETVRNLPVLPDVVSRIEEELIRQFDLLSLVGCSTKLLVRRHDERGGLWWYFLLKMRHWY
jgi:hypothetical protein